MKRNRNLIVGIVATTATALIILTTVSSPDNTLPVASPPTHTSTPEIPEGAGNCAYTWAYKDAPELTETFSAAVAEINPSATARAQFFGEDCLRSDGSVTFGAMETDFYVQLPVDDLSQQEELGNFAAQVMELVTLIPREDLEGPNYGFVEFKFEKTESERLILRIPIQQYINESSGKTGTELFLLFYPPP